MDAGGGCHVGISSLAQLKLVRVGFGFGEKKTKVVIM